MYITTVPEALAYALGGCIGFVLGVLSGIVEMMHDPLGRMLCIAAVGIVYLVIHVRRTFKE